jgi:hypothetical protein
MDPFLESQVWEDFHTRLITTISDWLAPQLRPRYVPRIEHRIYVERPFESGRIIKPDVIVARGLRPPERSQAAPSASTAALLEPTPIELAISEERKESFLTIRHPSSGQVVTVIEVLSPSNKRSGGDGRAVYLAKRDDVLHSRTNLVEIDLLRGGLRMPSSTPLPAGDYFAVVRQGGRSLQADVYHWRLADTLPLVPVPLSLEDADATIDLQSIVSSIYDRASYAFSIGYDLPVEPALTTEQAIWADEILAAWSRRE